MGEILVAEFTILKEVRIGWYCSFRTCRWYHDNPNMGLKAGKQGLDYDIWLASIKVNQSTAIEWNQTIYTSRYLQQHPMVDRQDTLCLGCFKHVFWTIPSRHTIRMWKLWCDYDILKMCFDRPWPTLEAKDAFSVIGVRVYDVNSHELHISNTSVYYFSLFEVWFLLTHTSSLKVASCILYHLSLLPNNHLK